MSSEEVIFTTPPLTKIWGNIFPLPIDSIILNSYDGGIVFNKINLSNFTQDLLPPQEGYTVTLTGDDGATKSFPMKLLVTREELVTILPTLESRDALGVPRIDPNPAGGPPIPERGPLKDSKTLSVTLTRKAKTQPLKLGATSSLAAVTPPAAVVLPTLYFDLSCWADTAAVPAISGGFVGNSNTNPYTVDKCYQRALTKGHDLFALQSGYKCYTGRLSTDNYKIHGAVTDSSQCTATGGTLVNHVYSVNSLSFVAPHDTVDYSSRSSAPALYSDFKDQTLGLVDSLSNVAMSNPAPFMTAMDADINSLRDSVTIEKLKDENSETILDATRMFEEAMDMSGVIQDGSTKSERLRREIVLTANQQSMYQKFLIPLQILGVTLILAVIAGSLLPAESSSIVLVILVVGFAFTLYFSLAKNRNHK